MIKEMTHPRPFEIADLISFYQSDNVPLLNQIQFLQTLQFFVFAIICEVMPKGETEEISKAASLANFMWKKRTNFRTQSRR
eukprot:UN15706